MIKPTSIYTVAEVAQLFKVSIYTIYQSLPSAKGRCKMGRKLPEPLRFGRSIRFMGQQLLDFASPPDTAQQPSAPIIDTRAVIKSRGRPRKTVQANLSAEGFD